MKLVEPVLLEPNAAVILVLEELLAEAKAGFIVGIAVAGVARSGAGYITMFETPTERELALLGALTLVTDAVKENVRSAESNA